MIRQALMAGCALGAMAGTARAVAADAAASEGADHAPTIAEVVVTATKRDTKLEETPIAITAVTQEAIDRQRLYNFTDIAQLAPGLVYTPLSRQESYPSIRGTTMGNGAAGADLAVSVFIDDVPTTGVGDDNPDLFDLQSIEILRGPQGTLFGRNVTGGAIVVRTLTPSFTPQLKAQVTYGNYNLAEFRGYATGPIFPGELAGKVAVEFRRQDGVLHDPYLNKDIKGTLLGGGRAQVLWTPNERLRVLLGGDFNIDGSDYKVQQLDGNFQPSLFPTLFYGPNDANQGIASRGDARTGGALARIDYSTPWGTLTSISGVRLVDDNVTFSTSAEPANQFIQHAYEQDQQFTEELRFASTGEGHLTYVAGLFFLDAHRRNRAAFDIHVVPDTLISFIDPFSALDFTSNNDQHITVQSYAAFGEANLAITPRLKLTLGARYTVESKSGHSEVTDTSGLSPDLISGTYSKTWSAFTPKATLSFQATDHLLAYVTAANGFKSGGFDTSATTVEGLRTPFQPEKVWSYEAGVKVTAFSQRLVVNADAYYADYTNLQLNAFDQNLLQNVTTNAGVSRIPGFELEIAANPLHWLSLNGSYTYMDAKYTRYIGPDGADFSGNQIAFDPKSQLHFGGEVHFQAAALAGGTLRLGGDVTYQSKRYFDDANDELPFILDNTPIKGLVNLHATWTSPNGAWEVSLWGKNVTDTRYIIYSTELTAFYATIDEFFSPAQNSIHVMDWSDPRMFGVTLTYRR